LIKCAQSEPQDITLHGKSVAVVLSREAYDRLSQSRMSLLDFMQKSPLREADDIEFTRDPSLTRDMGL